MVCKKADMKPAGIQLSTREIKAFQNLIYRFYKKSGRHDLPWRNTTDPYQILVSEYMLQQTQVSRVLKKYDAFIGRFPDVSSLARAPLRRVLAAWQGLGYNRRAIALRVAADMIIRMHKGQVPSSPKHLLELPGVGMATASAVMAFAFNEPVVFIETNIRRVFIHLFFSGRHQVTDRQLLPLIEQTLDRRNPRVWYYALMDYGSAIGTKGSNPNRRSAHHALQPRFAGSNRQLRGRILRLLLDHHCLSSVMIADALQVTHDRTWRCLAQLQQEGFVKDSADGYRIA